MLARITRQKAQLFQFPAQFRIEFDQSASNAQLGGSRLPDGTSASCVDQDIELIGCFRSQMGLPHDGPRGLAGKIVFERAAVDGDLAAAGSQENSGNRGLAAARTEML